MAKKISKHIFMAGIGGAGMTALAVFLRQRGDYVCGFDDFLKREAEFFLNCWDVEVIDRPCELPQCDVFVHTAALAKKDPLLQKALASGLATFSRGHYLAHVLEDEKLLAVVGSHGKTTTTALIIDQLERMNFRCNYLLGGRFEGLRAPACYQHAPWTIAEIDESEESFERFSPQITLVLNLSMDHDSYYGNLQKLRETFGRLLSRTKQRVLMARDEESLSAFMRLSNVSTFSRNISTESNDAKYLGANALNRDNIAASLAAVGALCELSTENDPSLPKIFYETVQKFRVPTILRRQNCLYDDGIVQVWVDYAHHPREVSAFLENYGQEDSIVVFQPHRYSRTTSHLDEFMEVLRNVPHLILLPTYGAFEPFDEQGTAEHLAERLAKVGKNTRCVEEKSIGHHLDMLLEGGSFRRVLFVGAGDIFSSAVDYGNSLRARRFLRLCRCLCPSLHIRENASLKSFTTMRVGGNARFFAEPRSVEELQRLLRCAVEANLRHFVIGAGSNVLVDDEGFFGLVIHLRSQPWESIALHGNTICVGAGVSLRTLAHFCRDRGIVGYSFCDGIPGTVGGAIAGNAGATNHCIGDFVCHVSYVDKNGALVRHQMLKFSYRQSSLPRGSVLVCATLHKSEQYHCPALISMEMSNMSLERKKKQPRKASAGSIFRNPPAGISSGKLIDGAGLKGVRVGGACISPVHGNFVVNEGSASCSDVLRLIFLMRRTVKSHFAIDMRTEVCFLANFWEGSF
jgi:UDP-N-acetylenolpyruvoylglucosamine reductase